MSLGPFGTVAGVQFVEYPSSTRGVEIPDGAARLGRNQSERRTKLPRRKAERRRSDRAMGVIVVGSRPLARLTPHRKRACCSPFFTQPTEPSSIQKSGLTNQYCSPSSSGAVTTRSGIAQTFTMTAIQ